MRQHFVDCGHTRFDRRGITRVNFVNGHLNTIYIKLNNRCINPHRQFAH